MIEHACEGLEDVEATMVVEEALKNLYDGVSISDMRASLIMSARTKVELEPNYSYVTARILLDELRSEALSFLGVAEQSTQQEMFDYYPKALQAFIENRLFVIIFDFFKGMLSGGHLVTPCLYGMGAWIGCLHPWRVTKQRCR